jgi:hypothetical protein
VDYRSKVLCRFSRFVKRRLNGTLVQKRDADAFDGIAQCEPFMRFIQGFEVGDWAFSRNSNRNQENSE